MRVFAALALLLLASCRRTIIDGPPPYSAAKSPDVSGAPFTLTAITVKGKEIPLPATRIPTMRFPEANRVNGLAGVNRYSGEVTFSTNGGVTFGPMITTKMAGPPEAMALESHFLDALSLVTRADLRGGKLKLLSADGQTRLDLAP